MYSLGVWLATRSAARMSTLGSTRPENTSRRYLCLSPTQSGIASPLNDRDVFWEGVPSSEGLPCAPRLCWVLGEAVGAQPGPEPGLQAPASWAPLCLSTWPWPPRVWPHQPIQT